MAKGSAGVQQPGAPNVESFCCQDTPCKSAKPLYHGRVDGVLGLAATGDKSTLFQSSVALYDSVRSISGLRHMGGNLMRVAEDQAGQRVVAAGRSLSVPRTCGIAPANHSMKHNVLQNRWCRIISCKNC